MLLGHAFCGLAAGQAFQFGRFQQVAQGIARLELVGPKQAKPLDCFVLQHERLARVPLDHFTDGFNLLEPACALEFFIPGHRPRLPIPTAGPTADLSRRSAPRRRRIGRSRAAAAFVVRAAGGVDAASRPLVAV